MTITQSSLKPRERNYGIDLLRIVSMFMVTLQHFCRQGGLAGTPQDGVSFYILTAFVVICYGAVDIFALISGYVMQGSKVKYHRLVSLWFQVFFYSVALSVTEYLSLGVNRIIPALFPVLTRQFWYFSAYFFMFFFIPTFNDMMERLSFKSMARFLITGFAILSIVSNMQKFFADDVISVGKGYNIIWLSYCYLAGAFISKYKECFNRIPNRKYIAAIAVCMGLTFIFNSFLYNWSIPIFPNRLPRDFFLVYTSPTVFLPSACLLVLFSKIRITKGKKAIKFFSSTAFSVYIIQTQPFLWDNYLDGYIKFFDNPTWYEKILIAVVSSVVLYLALTLVDFIRIQLFKLIHIESLSIKISKLFEKLVLKFKSYFSKIA